MLVKCAQKCICHDTAVNHLLSLAQEIKLKLKESSILNVSMCGTAKILNKGPLLAHRTLKSPYELVKLRAPICQEGQTHSFLTWSSPMCLPPPFRSWQFLIVNQFISQTQPRFYKAKRNSYSTQSDQPQFDYQTISCYWTLSTILVTFYLEWSGKLQSTLWAFKKLLTVLSVPRNFQYKGQEPLWESKLLEPNLIITDKQEIQPSCALEARIWTSHI